jgi:hypothetical protein
LPLERGARIGYLSEGVCRLRAKVFNEQIRKLKLGKYIKDIAGTWNWT